MKKSLSKLVKFDKNSSLIISSIGNTFRRLYIVNVYQVTVKHTLANMLDAFNELTLEI